MESLAVVVAVMFFGSILLALASIIFALLARTRPRLRPFAWGVVGASTLVGIWFYTMSAPLAAAPLIGGVVGLVLMGLQLAQKR